MTHEYVIALGGVILGAGAGTEPHPTAIAWAADRVLAVGPDAAVRAISRGDSTFIVVDGRAISALPSDPDRAEALLRQAIAAARPFDALHLLADAGLLGSAERIETGDPADIAFWSSDPTTLSSDAAASFRLVAAVRAGAFTSADEHRGPFPMTG